MPRVFANRPAASSGLGTPALTQDASLNSSFLTDAVNHLKKSQSQTSGQGREVRSP